MNKLKSFSGGNERAEQAIQLIYEQLRDFDDSSSHSDCLRTVLRNNKEALIHKQAAVPYPIVYQNNYEEGFKMENFNSLSLNDLRSLTGGVRIYGSNGYAWTDKHGHWHYTVTKGAVDTVFGIIGNGWGSAGASGRQH